MMRGMSLYQSASRILPILALALIAGAARGQVMTGLDVLEKNDFRELQGRKVGIVTNQTGSDKSGRHIVDLLTHAKGVTVVKLFSPEHGLYGVKDEKVGDMTDEKSGLPVVSLYGKITKPTKEMLAGVDTLVFDIQDVGARFYTYSATLGRCMEAAKDAGVRYVVLDRPNPMTGLIVDGPIEDKEYVGRFTAYGPIPVAHGMTFGELASLYNEEYGIHADLQVIKMEGWTRDMWWSDTGLPWTNPSPNMRNPTEALLYPGLCLMEATNVSVGRGTDVPFECIGTPYADARKLADALNEQKLPGLYFTPMEFTPTYRTNNGKACHGVRIEVTDRN
jgi:uncharacterized protein YbbC (DUF1343 family)